MSPRLAGVSSIDEYIATHPPQIQVVLKRIRAGIHKATPTAQETISYRMPAFTLNGILVYFAAFKHHIGLYPPIHGGNESFRKRKARYEGPKGNLKFPIDQPIPYALITSIVKLRAQQNMAKAVAKGKAKRKRRTS
jgi:uncharacterized protein YdhG (YjbR/CyaY superfamily)